ncbi:MAG: hypothetical protein ACK56F_18785, partial [bacterium]
ANLFAHRMFGAQIATRPEQETNPRNKIWLKIGAPNLIRIAICAGRLRSANIMAQGCSARNFICGQNMPFLSITRK